MRESGSNKIKPTPLIANVPIILGFVAVSVAFSVATPLLEAPDETSHLDMVHYLYQHRALPIQRPGDFPAGQEGSEPPLYYALGAVLFSVSPQPTIVLDNQRNQNPNVNFHRAAEPRDNRNLYAHTLQEQFPYRGDVLGAHLVRLLGVVLGIFTVLLTFLSARELFPDHRFLAPLATALVAFNPQFAFLSGVVNDDDGIACAATLVLWLLLRRIRRGGSPRLALALGVALGCAVLMKVSGILLLPLAGLALVGEAEMRARRFAPQAVLVAVPFLIVTGWWLVRNQILYGDPLGWSMMLAANWQMIRPSPLSIPEALAILWRARGTYWGMFGWTNVAFPDLVYRLIDVGTGIALVGLVIGLGRTMLGEASGRRRFALVLLVIWPLLIFASLVHWLQINRAADQWRLLFPAVAPIAILLALGIEEIIQAPSRLWRKGPPRSRWPAALAIGLLLTALGIAGNFFVLRDVIIATYAPVFEQPSAVAAPIYRFGDAVELLGAHLISNRIGPGESLDLDLNWRTQSLLQKNWSVSVTLVGPDGKVLASARGWPQGGRAPTSAWPPGDIVPEHYRLTPNWSGVIPEQATVWLGVYDGTVPGGPSLPVIDAKGQSIGTGVSLGTIILRPTTLITERPSQPLRVQFTEGIQLVGYDLAENSATVLVTLFWRAAAQPSQSYTVFVHLTDARGKVVAQQDGLPLDGASPTVIWEAGDLIPDRHRVMLKDVPPGIYQVWVGLYRHETGQRLTILSSGGRTVDQNAVNLSTTLVR